MTRLGRSVLFLMLGAHTVKLVVSGESAWFVHQRMRIPLLLSAVVLLGLAAADAIYDTRHHPRTEPTTDAAESGAGGAGARRSIAPRVGWLLALPLMVIVAVAPTALGASAANRVGAFVPTAGSNQYDALDAPVDDAIPMRVYEFLDRAIWDDSGALENVDVALEGIVVNGYSAPDGFLLTRFLVSCCAADGVPLQVRVRGVPDHFENDTWVRAVVRWRPPAVPYREMEWPWTVEADHVRIEVMKAPGNPYESPS